MSQISVICGNGQMDSLGKCGQIKERCGQNLMSPNTLKYKGFVRKKLDFFFNGKRMLLGV